MKMTSNTKGQLAVSKAELRAFELGYLPSRPLYDARYDLILDDGKKLIRAQVKYADGHPSNTEGAVAVKLDYEDRSKKFYTYHKNEVDVLIVYIPKVDKLCLFPLSVFAGKRKMNIRIQKPKINYSKDVKFAKNYYW